MEELSCPEQPRRGAQSSGQMMRLLPAGGGWVLRIGGSADTGWGWAGAWPRRSAPCESCTHTAGGTEKHSQRMSFQKGWGGRALMLQGDLRQVFSPL